MSDTAHGELLAQAYAEPPPSHADLVAGSDNGLLLALQVLTGLETAAFPVHAQEVLQQSYKLS